MGPSYSSRALAETRLVFTPVSPIISHTNLKIMPLKNKRFLWMSFVSYEYTNQTICISCQTWGQIHLKVFKYITITFTDQ